MPALVDFTGKKFGKLTVLNRTGSARGWAVWNCICDCGNYIEKSWNQLTSKGATNCGCVPRGQKSVQISGAKHIYRHYERSAAKRGYPFEISLEEFTLFLFQPCFYCGRAPANQATLLCRQKRKFIYQGLDRINNNNGYTPDNLVSCCIDCNRAKSNLTQDEFLLWINTAYNHLSATKVL